MRKNRYGNEYEFCIIDDNTMTIQGALDHWRFGGREGTQGVDMEDLGFVDPSGGPFISVGMTIEGREITRIRANDGQIFFHSEGKNHE